MLRLCADHHIYLPAEGNASQSLELSLGRFLQVLGRREIMMAGHFGFCPKLIQRAEVFDDKTHAMEAELCSLDKSVYVGN